jgi:hypothetical protein
VTSPGFAQGAGSHCDVHPYRGHIAGVITTGHCQTTLWAAEVGHTQWWGRTG